VIAVLVMSGCRAAGTAGTSIGPSAIGSQHGIPSGEPSIRGIITAIDESGRVRVEETPSLGSRVAVVRITPAARIMHRSGRPAVASDLSVGLHVTVWYSGPVAESFPVQAVAGVVVIESGS